MTENFKIDFNPFSHLVETPEARTARMVRRGFKNRTRDCFNAFYGNIDYDMDERADNVIPNSRIETWRLGIFDYATLGVATLIRGAHVEAYDLDQNKIVNKIAAMIIGLLRIVESAARGVIAAAATIACLPFIGIAHLATSKKRKRLLNEVKNLEVVKQDGSTAKLVDLMEPGKDIDNEFKYNPVTKEVDQYDSLFGQAAKTGESFKVASQQRDPYAQIAYHSLNFGQHLSKTTLTVKERRVAKAEAEVQKLQDTYDANIGIDNRI